MAAAVVFISYSHDSEAHRERVLGLSESLRLDGFDTRLDRYENPSPAQGWTRWMLDQLDAADWVLVVCTESYYSRFRGRHEAPGVGKGADFEGLSIMQQIYDAGSTNTKFVPVLFERADETFIPEPLRPGSHYSVDSPDGYAKLVAALRRVVGVEPGPIRPAPDVSRPRGEPLRFDTSALFQTPHFSMDGADAKRLHDVLIKAYPKKPRISGLLDQTRIRERDVVTDGTVSQVWVAVLEHAARVGLLRDLVETAAKDDTIAPYHGDLRKLLDADAAGMAVATSADESLMREVDALLSPVGRSRTPIIIALEVDDEPLTEFELVRTACHLTVTLTAAQVQTLEGLSSACDNAESVEGLASAGRRVWQELTAAEPRVATLHDRIRQSGPSQPVAWCARPALLARIASSVQIAHTDGQGARGFMSVGAGGHYFTPLRDTRLAGDARSMKHRANPGRLTVGVFDGRGVSRDRSMVELADVSGDVLIAVQPSDAADLADVAAVVRADALGSTRAVLTFGGRAPVDDIDNALDVVPFLACADADLGAHVLDTLTAVVRRYAENVTMPCIVSAVRQAWIERAMERDDIDACRSGLLWRAWSWVGHPLFSRSYGEVDRPLYPHLNDLRSVASHEWYFDRKQRIKTAYQASELARTTGVIDRFHLYLSGGGGTGKSCFMHHVYDEIDERPNSIAVWYRVDAPSSSWENVESRIRDETVKAVAEKLDRKTAEAVEQLPGSLGDFLSDAAKLLLQQDETFDEIAVFIDQLERTFESGDEPNSHRLETISNELIGVLNRVGVDGGVRVFVASRKQYLPDFLVSYRDAQACRLEFNVLQAISDETERTAFIDRVVEWCREYHLISPTVRMSTDATRTLVGHLDGNPLNMMLALIYLLSQHFTGVITDDDVDRYEPWNRLFLLDLVAAERDELDWHFLLAMSHARTEIVRFEEVLWRIRMVSAPLTRRVDDLRREGVIERMWLLGILGRTVHARPLGKDPVRFVEFFHANLRDYLLREVMGYGRSATGLGGRYGGTPATWRALDRLSGFARDWAQTLQPLLAEEIRVLMEHKAVVVQDQLVPDEDATPPFYLLFLRDPSGARKELSTAAMACFAYSALVHDEQGKWAMETLFPDVDEQVDKCGDWLRRSPQELRPSILRYLIPLEPPAPRKLLTELLVDVSGPPRDQIAQAAALVLTEPLYAARYRNEVLLRVLGDTLPRVGGDPNRLAPHVSALVVAACGHDRDTVLSVLSYCVDRLSTSEDANLRALAPSLQGFTGVDEWLGAATAAPVVRGVGSGERGEGLVPMELSLGASLRSALPDSQPAEWSAALRERLGVPLADLELTEGELEIDEAELRFYGQRVSRRLFRPGLFRVSKRLWELSGGARSPDAVEDMEGGEDVLWLPAAVVAEANYRFAALGFEHAVVEWLESRCRRAFDQLLDVDVQVAYIRQVAATAAGRRRLRRIGGHLRPVLVELIEEGVPLGPRESFLEQLADLVPRVRRTDQLVQQMREHLKAGICRAVVDKSGQVTTILLAEQLEHELADLVDGQGRLALTPAGAIRLDNAIRRQVIRKSEEELGPPLVLVTIPRLRLALSRLLRRLDHRLPVLSFTELEGTLIPVPGGLVDLVLESGDRA